ncbi:hypothetical protein THRCLA_04104, partial [Thraustotheca clavata]
MLRLLLLVVAVLALDDKSSRQTKVFLLPEKERFHLSPLLNGFRKIGAQELYGADAMTWKAAKRTQDFDIIWSWDSTQIQELGPLERRHKVNHVPGSYVLTNKGYVYETLLKLQSIHGEDDYNFMPKQYRLPKEAEIFTAAFEERKNQVQETKEDDPDYNKRWLLKQQSHRGVRFFSGLDQIDAHMNSNDMVAQCIEPLLVSGHKFDLGIYVAITSIDPLRIYIYQNSVLRMCKLKYPKYLDETADLESYVVVDYLPPWEMPDLQEFYPEFPSPTQESTSNFQVIKKYLGKVGIDSEKFQAEIYSAVVKIIAGNREHFMNSEKTVRRQTKQPHEQLGNFFEMYRFDFVVEDTGKPWLMEVNQSPSMKPKYFKSGTDVMMKNNLIHNLLYMVDIKAPGQPSVNLPQLSDAKCNEKCSDVENISEVACWRCPGWFTEKEANTLLEGATEYARRGNFNLVYPTVDDEFTKFVTGGLTQHDKAFQRFITSIQDKPEDLTYFRPAMCTSRQQCNWHGNCVNGGCVCDSGYDGNICSTYTGKERHMQDSVVNEEYKHNF